MARRAGVARAARAGRLPLWQQPRPGHQDGKGACMARGGPQPRPCRRAAPSRGLADPAPGYARGEKDCAGGRATPAWDSGWAGLARRAKFPKIVRGYGYGDEFFFFLKKNIDGDKIWSTLGDALSLRII